MLRCLSAGVLLISLTISSSANAQTDERPGFAERVKSLFSRREEPPKPRLKPNARLHPKRAQAGPEKPVQVTTRSGSLRQPGPEVPAPVAEPAHPTFAAPDLARQSQPRMFNAPTDAKKLAKPQSKAHRSAIRDSAVAPAGYESQKPKKTMASWFRGLWSRDKSSEDPSTAAPPSRMSPQPGQSTSIDPRRVYRAPNQTSDRTPRPSASARSTDFSETGVPRSTSAFRGRSDSAF